MSSIIGHRTVLVAGSQGVSGRAVAEEYAKLPETTVYGISRRPYDGASNARHLPVDLLDQEDVSAKLGPVKDITHVFFGAYLDRQDPAEKSAVNVHLLEGLLNHLKENAPNLRQRHDANWPFECWKPILREMFNSCMQQSLVSTAGLCTFLALQLFPSHRLVFR